MLIRFFDLVCFNKQMFNYSLMSCSLPNFQSKKQQQSCTVVQRTWATGALFSTQSQTLFDCGLKTNQFLSPFVSVIKNIFFENDKLPHCPSVEQVLGSQVPHIPPASNGLLCSNGNYHFLQLSSRHQNVFKEFWTIINFCMKKKIHKRDP